MSNNDRYNGWTNYETWVTALWMDNEQGSQEWAQEQAQLALNDAEGDKDEAKGQLASVLEAYHDEVREQDGIAMNGVWSDLLNHALGRVEWYEIAHNLLEDTEYTQETDDEE